MRALFTVGVVLCCAAAALAAENEASRARVAADAAALDAIAGPLTFGDWFGTELDETSPDPQLRAAARALDRVPEGYMRAYRHFLLTGEEPSKHTHPDQDLAPQTRFRSHRRSTLRHASRSEEAVRERASARRVSELLYGKGKTSAGVTVTGGDARSICQVAAKHYKAVVTNTGAAPTVGALEALVVADSNWLGGSKVWSTWSWIPIIGGGETDRIRHLITHVCEAVIYRILHLGGRYDDPALCETQAIEVAVSAVVTTHDPPGGPNPDFAFGIEEEFHDVQLRPNTEDVTPILRSTTACPAPRSFDYFRVTADHSSRTGAEVPIVELITGPLPISWANRNLHRAVSNTFYAQIPKSPTPGTPGTFGDWTPLQTVLNNFNGAIDAAAGNAHYQTAYPRVHHDFEVRHMALTSAQRTAFVNLYTRAVPNNAMAPSIQVNFECSLCSVSRSAGFLTLSSIDGNTVLATARAAARAHIARDVDFPRAQFNAMTGRQQCELEGILTIMYMNALYRPIKAVNDAAVEESKHRAAEAHAGRVPPAWSAGATAIIADRFWGGTSKNFFAVMIKTGMEKIVSMLPLPVADMLWKFHARVTAAARDPRRLITLPMHNALMAAMRDAGMPMYNNRAVYFDANGDYFNRVLGWLGNALHNAPARNGDGGDGLAASSPIGNRSPPAFIRRNPLAAADQMVTFVAEVRKTRSPLNLAFSEELFGINAASYALAVPVATAQVDNLLNNVAISPV